MTLYVAGNFDSTGRESRIARTIHAHLGLDAEYHNGGSFADLERILASVPGHELIFWFPNVPNDGPKLLPAVKELNSECVLVTSKRNDGRYSFGDLTYHALRNKSNLFIEFNKAERYTGRVLDPLGNAYLDHTEDFAEVGRVVGSRAKDLLTFTRMHSRSAGEALPVPDEEEFFTHVRSTGDTFHRLIQAADAAQGRFFGNASFRCERGFPSFREHGLIYVSRRDIDKRHIGSDGFVAVDPGLPVSYHGSMKPSVDTPIQVVLYDRYPDVKFMLHGHAYIKGAPFTKRVIPCGAMEEVDEITAISPAGSGDFSVNLLGHGSIGFATDVAYLKTLEYYPRPFPELHCMYTRRDHG